MLARYTTEPMKEVWSELAKFGLWLRTEFAVLEARRRLGLLECTIAELRRMRRATYIDLDKMAEKEALGGHDLIAFVETTQSQLFAAGLSQVTEFHKGMTSYDTEEAPAVLQLHAAVTIIIDTMVRLEKALRAKAVEHKWTLMIADTHGQFAEPSTLGHIMMVFAEAVARSIADLRQVKKAQLREAKISGAVGNYPLWNPDVERVALKILGLRPAKAETQFLQRDRHARVLSAIAVAAGTIQQIADFLWLRSQSIYGEVQEPKISTTKSSSAMSHKVNPDVIERILGMARLVFTEMTASVLNIATHGWRDISQSNVEREIFPTATSQIQYMAEKLAGIVEKLVVKPKTMKRNLEKTQGVWASQRVRTAMLNKGIPYEIAYRHTQQLAFRAIEEEVLYLLLLKSKPVEGLDQTVESLIGESALLECFDPYEYIKVGINHIVPDGPTEPPAVESVG